MSLSPTSLVGQRAELTVASPGRRARQSSYFRRHWMAAAALLIVSALHAAPALAQGFIVVGNASVTEGNAGTRILSFPFNFQGGVSPANTVTGKLSVISLTGSSFNPATTGASCSAGVDFIGFNAVAFSVPPNTLNGSLMINVTICGDAVIEPNEHVAATVTEVVGAACTELCAAIGVILNDDGQPGITINNISTSEPIFATRTTAFTVSLSHASTLPVSVNFATRSGSASTKDFAAAAGVLQIPAGADFGTLSVTIKSDTLREIDETFFVDLSSPVNATISDGIGQATIRDTGLIIGNFNLSPSDVRTTAGDTVTYLLDWIVPDNLVWRNLKTLDLRLSHKGRTALWVRWDEASNEFSLCSQVKADGQRDDDNDDNDDDEGRNAKDASDAQRPVACAAGALPGSGMILASKYAIVNLRDVAVVGSGPTGSRVSLTLPLQLLRKASSRTYDVELAAADDLGNVDNFVRAGSLKLESSK